MTEPEAKIYRSIVNNRVDQEFYDGALSEYLNVYDSTSPFVNKDMIREVDYWLLSTIDKHEVGLCDSKQFLITNVANRDYRFICLDISGVEFIFNARTNTGRKIIRKFLKSNAVFYAGDTNNPMQKVQLDYLRLVLKYPVDKVNEIMREKYPLPDALTSLLVS